MSLPKFELFAANKTSLLVEGDMDIHFTINGHPMTTDVSVSPAIDDSCLEVFGWRRMPVGGIFAAGTVRISYLLIQTHRKGSIDASRRVFVLERCVILPNHEANVKVCVVYDDFSCPATDSAVEPRTISSGVIAARIFFSDGHPMAVMRVLNYSNELYTLKADSFLSSAESVSVVSESESAGSTEQCEHPKLSENPLDRQSERLLDLVVTKSDRNNHAVQSVY